MTHVRSYRTYGHAPPGISPLAFEITCTQFVITYFQQHSGNFKGGGANLGVVNLPPPPPTPLNISRFEVVCYLVKLLVANQSDDVRMTLCHLLLP